MADESFIERLRKLLTSRWMLIAVTAATLGLAVIWLTFQTAYYVGPIPTPTPSPRPRLPEFPWPPRSSTYATVSKQYVTQPKGQTLLRDVGLRLETAFRSAGYEQTGYYSVPGGFALTSRLEQFKQNGLPADEPYRWSTEIPIPSFFSVEYLTTLIKGKTGHYRVIVFVVTNDFFSQESGKTVDSEKAETMAIRGAKSLPDAVGLIPFKGKYECTALIYEFEKTSSDQAKFKENATLSADRHLQQILPHLRR